MNDTLINDIVAKVLKQLQHRDEAASSSTATSPNSVLTLADAVLTEASLENQIKGAQQIAIGPKTILTPTARDYLRQRNITWHRQSTNQTTATNATWKAVLLQAADRWPEISRTAGATFSKELVNSPQEAAQAATSAICRGEANDVIVLADAAAAVACFANRNQQVRAATINTMNELQPLKESLDPNVYCIAPADRSFMELRNLVRACTRH